MRGFLCLLSPFFLALASSEDKDLSFFYDGGSSKLQLTRGLPFQLVLHKKKAHVDRAEGSGDAPAKKSPADEIAARLDVSANATSVKGHVEKENGTDAHFLEIAFDQGAPGVNGSKIDNLSLKFKMILDPIHT